MAGLAGHNLASWIAQTIVIALVGAVLPIALRVRSPRVQLVYCHLVLAFCLLLPFVQPWRSAGHSATGFVDSHGPWLFGALAAGVVAQLAWISGGLLRIRRYRIAATPLYPAPDAMKAASAITHADALFCVSEEATGPLMLGWLAPVVLLPPAFLAMDEEAQCGIACHELLHVRRGDWMVTLIEEFAGAVMWFNPGIWLLLSEARLAREQLVDAESVRLTASLEPYIDALLEIARAHTWSDLAPAPTFLRRSHLTQRMQMLLSERPASMRRVVWSFGTIALLLAGSVWMACAAFPLLSRTSPSALPVTAKSAPAPPPMAPPAVKAARSAMASISRSAPERIDSNPANATNEPTAVPAIADVREPVGETAEIVSTPIERSAALALLTRARQRALRHAPGTPPYRFTVSFQAAGNVLETGPGELTETWMNGQLWRWTASLGGVSHTQLRYGGQLLEDRHVAAIPMRAQMLRNEILWGTRGLQTGGSHFRTARVQWQGKAVTCLLISENDEGARRGRSWDEEEYCVDEASAELVVHSMAPGTYAEFTYGGEAAFRGYALADQVRIYVNGALAADAAFRIEDAGQADWESLVPAAGMTGTPVPLGLGVAFHGRVDAEGGDSSQVAIVHAEIDGEGKVVESELSGATNAGLYEAAAERVRKMSFGQTGMERQGYIDVRF